MPNIPKKISINSTETPNVITLLPSMVSEQQCDKIHPSHAGIGDKISFTRKGYSVDGIVVSYRQKTVIVQISPHSAKLLDIENDITIVNHKNYEIVSSTK